MTRAAVERRTGLGPSALYRVMREGRFPAPFKVRRSVGRSVRRPMLAARDPSVDYRVPPLSRTRRAAA